MLTGLHQAILSNGDQVRGVSNTSLMSSTRVSDRACQFQGLGLAANSIDFTILPCDQVQIAINKSPCFGLSSLIVCSGYFRDLEGEGTGWTEERSVPCTLGAGHASGDLQPSDLDYRFKSLTGLCHGVSYALGGGTLSICILSWPRSKWVPSTSSRTEKVCVCVCVISSVCQKWQPGCMLLGELRWLMTEHVLWPGGNCV